jgi:hypothetical protein
MNEFVRHQASKLTASTRSIQTTSTIARTLADLGSVLMKKTVPSASTSKRPGWWVTLAKGHNNCLVITGRHPEVTSNPLHPTLSSTPLWSPFAGGRQCSTFLSYETPAATEGHPFK